MDLVAFLTARLDEDEATAKAATRGPWSHDSSWGEFLQTPEGSINGDGYARAEDVIHQARWDPLRVLREVEAKRRILDCAAALDADGYGYGHGGVNLLCIVAAVYSDHADYDPAWA